MITVPWKPSAAVFSGDRLCAVGARQGAVTVDASSISKSTSAEALYRTETLRHALGRFSHFGFRPHRRESGCFQDRTSDALRLRGHVARGRHQARSPSSRCEKPIHFASSEPASDDARPPINPNGRPSSSASSRPMSSIRPTVVLRPVSPSRCNASALPTKRCSRSGSTPTAARRHRCSTATA